MTTWLEIGYLGLALVLSAAIGLEREVRQKAAGLRTHTLVGLASALIMIISKWGFADALGDHVVLDPSRVAAQVVSGIGFLGAGLIFIRRDAVRGLTTAAAIWLTSAVGLAAGAGLWILALAVTAAHFVVVFGLTALSTVLPRSRYAPSRLHLTYLDGQGVLRVVLAETTRRDFAIAEITVDHPDTREPHDDDQRTVGLWLTVTGRGSITDLTATLADVAGVVSITAGDANATTA